MFRNPLILIVALLMLAFSQPAFVSADLTTDLQSEINQKRSQIQELEKQIAEFKQMLQTTQSQGATLKQQITRLETQIKKLETQIRLTQTKISAASLTIQGLSSDIATQNVELEKQKNNLGQILRTVYEYDQESPFSLILENSNFSDFFNQVQYVNNLQTSVQDELTEIKNLKAELQAKKTDYENQKSALQDLKGELHGQSLTLDNQKDEKQDLLTTTKNQEKQYQTTLTDLQKKRDQIEREIFLAEEKLRLAIDPNSIPGARKGVLAWPIQDPLSQTFGCIETKFAKRSYPECNNGKGGFHNGIDIDADLGDPVRAALAGTISGVGNLGKYSYGRWITIKHDNGLTTLYGHLSAQSITVGQKVSTSQIIGYAGNTGYSTGSHLHFTVYATNTFSIQQKWYGPVPLGGPINPLIYL